MKIQSALGTSCLCLSLLRPLLALEHVLFLKAAILSGCKLRRSTLIFQR